MAIRSCPHIMFPRGQTSKTATRVATPCNSQLQPNRTPAASLVNYNTPKKVYEDQSLGIVCYQDEHGEVICEGLDEGPRYSRWASAVVHEESLREHGDTQIPSTPRHRRRLRGEEGRRTQRSLHQMFWLFMSRTKTE